ncbi:somatoliberin [Amia ocellicauda]|uniref:somatoliberin n=1 Tax=Amia ocellicauda TaxID=2972642 RepID=UPI003464B2FC
MRFGQKASAASILVSSSTENHSQVANDSTPQRDITEKRTGRHADAIFTNSYRKVLGQISARKFLQTIMGKRLGKESSETTMKTAKRQTGMYADTYRQALTTIERKQRYRGRLGLDRPRITGQLPDWGQHKETYGSPINQPLQL